MATRESNDKPATAILDGLAELCRDHLAAARLALGNDGAGRSAGTVAYAEGQVIGWELAAAEVRAALAVRKLAVRETPTRQVLARLLADLTDQQEMRGWGPTGTLTRADGEVAALRALRDAVRCVLEGRPVPPHDDGRCTLGTPVAPSTCYCTGRPGCQALPEDPDSDPGAADPSDQAVRS